MDDPTRPEHPAPQTGDAPMLPTPERPDLAARLDDLGKSLSLDEHGFWRVPDGWTEAALRDLAGQLSMPLDVMAHLAVTTTQGALPGDQGGWNAGVPRFDFEAREESAELRRLRKAEHVAGAIARTIRCQGRGCRRVLSRLRQNPDAAGGVELVLIGPVSLDPSTGTYVFGPGHPSRASDLNLLGVGPGQRFDRRWNIAVRCSCGYADTLFVGRVLREAARQVYSVVDE